ncbi:Hypothetical Methyltransferase (fragment) [Clostridium chauvoei JF4335]
MEDLKKAIHEIIEDNIIKIVVSNKMNKDVEYNKINFTLKENSKRKIIIKLKSILINKFFMKILK